LVWKRFGNVKKKKKENNFNRKPQPAQLSLRPSAGPPQPRAAR
jgi:hypothetical protein